MQQEKRRRVFRAGLSVENGQSIYLHRAIKSRGHHRGFPSVGGSSRNRDQDGTENLQALCQMGNLKSRIDSALFIKLFEPALVVF